MGARRRARRLVTWRRRAVSIPVVVVGFGGGVLAAPVVIPAAAMFDLCRRRPALPLVRLFVFAVAMLALEVWAVTTAMLLWCRFGFGRRLASETSQAAHSAMQLRWAQGLAAVARGTLGLRFDLDSTGPLARATGPVPVPAVAVTRHSSYADALLPVLLFGSPGRRLRYVLTAGLSWDPALDVFGHRLPNHFVDRRAASGTGAAGELLAIGRLARGMGRSDVAVIFPEGQFATRDRRARAAVHLRTQDPERAARTATLRHLLPIRPGGVLALVGGAPAGSDVVFVGHVGLEGFGAFGELWKNLPLRVPVRVRMWRVPATELPSNRGDRVNWLDEHWQRVDDWVHQELAAEQPGAALLEGAKQ